MVQSHWALSGFKISYFSTTATSSYWWTVLSCSFCFLTFVLSQHGHVLSDIRDIPCQIMSIYGHVSWCFMMFHNVSSVSRWWRWSVETTTGGRPRCRAMRVEQQQRKAALPQHLKATQFQTRLGGWCHGDVMVMSWWCHDMISIYLKTILCDCLFYFSLDQFAVRS